MFQAQATPSSPKLFSLTKIQQKIRWLGRTTIIMTAIARQWSRDARKQNSASVIVSKSNPGRLLTTQLPVKSEIYELTPIHASIGAHRKAKPTTRMKTPKFIRSAFQRYKPAVFISSAWPARFTYVLIARLVPKLREKGTIQMNALPSPSADSMTSLFSAHANLNEMLYQAWIRKICATASKHPTKYLFRDWKTLVSSAI